MNSPSYNSAVAHCLDEENCFKEDTLCILWIKVEINFCSAFSVIFPITITTQ